MATVADGGTLDRAIDALKRRGFTESLSVVDGRLRVGDSPKTFGPQEVAIRAYCRFEGASDPDDMAIVYAIEAPGGRRGILVDAYGAYSDPAVGAFLAAVPMGRGR